MGKYRKSQVPIQTTLVPSHLILGGLWGTCYNKIDETFVAVMYLGPVLGHLRPFLDDLSPGLGLVERVTEGVTEVELRVTEVTGPLSD